MAKKTIKDASASKEKASYAAPALEKAFNVLELLAERQRGLTVSEIASGLNLSVSEIFRIIIVMERRGWLRKAPGDKYSVTPLMLHLAFRATPAEELSSVAIPYMRELCAAADQSCHLVIRNGDKGLVIARQQNPGPTGFHVRIGSAIDLRTTCSGHVLLAFAAEQKGSHAHADLDKAFVGVLNAVRQRGYQRMESTRTLGVTDISFPIFEIHGDVVAALTVPFLRCIDGSQSISLDQAQALLEQAAKRISDEFGVKQESILGAGQ